MTDRKELESKAKENIALISQKLIDARKEVRGLTNTYGYECIFKLTDDDWERVTGFYIKARLGFEVISKQNDVAELLDLAFSVD